jgi:hypothetical protein
MVHGLETLKRLNDEAVAKKQKRIVVATCTESWHQGVYVNGELRDSDSSLFANVVGRQCEPNEPVFIENIDCVLSNWDEFPSTLEELIAGQDPHLDLASDD